MIATYRSSIGEYESHKDKPIFLFGGSGGQTSVTHLLTADEARKAAASLIAAADKADAAAAEKAREAADKKAFETWRASQVQAPESVAA